MKFDKYQAAGNDFVIIDNRDKQVKASDNERIRLICDRHFGVGADGLMLFERSDCADFYMRYFNADGAEGSLCGNGSRAIVTWAALRNLIESECTLEAFDGIHRAKLNKLDKKTKSAIVSIEMNDITEVQKENDGIFLDTGSPHFISYRKDLATINVEKEGSDIRNSPAYVKNGTNVNFVEVMSNHKLSIRTYERGVEAETLACGTGVTAAAIASAFEGLVDEPACEVTAIGGTLKVFFEKNGSGYKNIWLEGPAQFVFSGELD